MLSLERLKALLHYDPETGLFTWLVSKGTVKSGKIAGTVGVSGSGREYINIRLDRKQYQGHRLAWFYMTGSWPGHVVDHEDGDGLNNKWLNLREATHNQNHYNQFLNRNNKSGVKGVNWHKGCQRWRASITYEGRKIHIGLFTSLDEAQVAIEKVRKELHGEFANNG